MAHQIDNHAILDRIRIRRMTGDEVAFTIDLAAGEGWNPGIHDGACFYATDPAGFFVAELDGELVGSISAVAYDDSFGFIGLYIVKPEFRGIGIGTRLGEAGMTYLTDHNIGPLFADNEHIAEILFRALKSHVPGDPVFFDTPEVNPKAVALAELHNMNVVFRTVRMYTNEEPQHISRNRIFGVTTFELG